MVTSKDDNIVRCHFVYVRKQEVGCGKDEMLSLVLFCPALPMFGEAIQCRSRHSSTVICAVYFSEQPEEQK